MESSLGVQVEMYKENGYTTNMPVRSRSLSSDRFSLSLYSKIPSIVATILHSADAAISHVQPFANCGKTSHYSHVSLSFYSKPIGN